jgi:hypothetical protein
MCFSGGGNAAIWAANGTMQSRLVLPYCHGMKRTFKAYGLLGNVDSISTKSRLTVTIIMMKQWERYIEYCSIFLFCIMADLSQAVLTRYTDDDDDDDDDVSRQIKIWQEKTMIK